MSFVVPIQRPSRVAFAVTLIAVIGLGSSLLLNQLASEVEQETAGLQSQLSAAERDLSVRSNQIKELSSMETAIDEFRETVDEQGELSVALATVRAIAVPGVEVSSVRVLPEHIAIRGTATGPIEYLDYVEALETSQMFTEVEYGVLRSGAQGIEILATKAKRRY